MKQTVIFFWLFATIVAVSWTWTSYLARLASEKTIRQAIDKGLVLDPAAIDRLRPQPKGRWHILLIVVGALVGSLGLGILVFGILLAFEDPEALFPMLGTAAIPTIGGAGCVMAGVWLRRQPRE